MKKLTRSQCRSVHGQIRNVGVYIVDAHPTALVFLGRMGYVIRQKDSDFAMPVRGGLASLHDQLKKARSV